MFVSNGWKLSHSGRDMLRSKWQGYDSVNDANTVSTGKILINMDLCCASPWCWRGKCITVWDPTLHFELQMVNGNLSEFVDFKSPRGM